MKIVFFMSHPGYTRNFESTMRVLAERGHRVHVAFDRRKSNLPGQESLIGDLARDHPEITFGDAPKRERSHLAQTSRQLRISVDFLRFLSPEFSRSERLRERMASRAPAIVVGLGRSRLARRPTARAAISSGLRTLDRSLPTPPSVMTYLSERQPDAVLVTPLLEIGTPQLDYLRASRALGIPNALCVASWDNLTTKGVIQQNPDLVTVWNEPQRREAVELHGVPSELVAVTGASAYDHWFDWSASTTRQEFCRERGLDPEQSMILYLGSSGFIAPNEAPYILRWVRQLRRERGALAQAGILVRPHPTNPLDGRTPEQRELASLEGVSVWPPAGSNPTDLESRCAYYDSIYHSSAVVGVNTSALIESAIVGRPIFTLLTPELEQAQEGSVHFHHLLTVGGGLLHVASSFEDHADQLEEAIRQPAQPDNPSRRFLEDFVRPFGLDVPATPHMVAAIEGLAEVRRGPVRIEPAAAPLLRRGLAVAAHTPLLGSRRLQRRPLALIGRVIRGRTGAPLRERVHHGGRLATRKALRISPVRAAAYQVAPRLSQHVRRTPDQHGAGAALADALLAEIRRAARQERKERASQTLWRGRGAPDPDRVHGQDRPLRVLFAMAYPGYLRYFDATVRELAARSHTVELCFNVDHKQAEGYSAFVEEEQNERISARRLPKIREETWKPIAQGSRTATDYLHYLDPRFGDAHYLRDRVGDRLPDRLSFIRRWGTLGKHRARLVPTVARALEAAIPTSRTYDELIASGRPDVLVVTPLVTVNNPQIDLAKSARAAGVPVILAVASWDHLTTKGLLRVSVDQVLVWNEIQVEEARQLHQLNPKQVVVTGAQPFDRWFEQRARPREVICSKAELPADRPYVLFLGSTASISAPEAERDFVFRWIRALRNSANPAVRDIGVLIRPHPYNPGLWANADLSGLGPVGVWPPVGANPVREEDRADYYDSLHYAAAAIGINTSAMVEAAIVGAPVFTVRTPEFTDTQTGTVHFGYLLRENGGPARAADSLQDHVRQLEHSGVLSGNGTEREALERFVKSFVRPKGLGQPAVPLLVDAIESMAARGVSEQSPPILARPLRAALWLVGTTMLIKDHDRFWASSEARGLAASSSSIVHRASRVLEGSAKPFGRPAQARAKRASRRLRRESDKLEKRYKNYLKVKVEQVSDAKPERTGSLAE